MGDFPNTETQFKAGNAGRPKGSRNRATIYREFVEQVAIKTVNDRLKAVLGECNAAALPKTIEEQVVAAMVMTALNGDVAAGKEIMDSIHGKITDKVATTHSFKKMGRVSVDIPDKITGLPVEVPLTFNVGEEPNQPEHEEEEIENE